MNNDSISKKLKTKYYSLPPRVLGDLYKLFCQYGGDIINFCKVLSIYFRIMFIDGLNKPMADNVFTCTYVMINGRRCIAMVVNMHSTDDKNEFTEQFHFVAAVHEMFFHNYLFVAGGDMNNRIREDENGNIQIIHKENEEVIYTILASENILYGSGPYDESSSGKMRVSTSQLPKQLRPDGGKNGYFIDWILVWVPDWLKDSKVEVRCRSCIVNSDGKIVDYNRPLLPTESWFTDHNLVIFEIVVNNKVVFKITSLNCCGESLSADISFNWFEFATDDIDTRFKETIVSVNGVEMTLGAYFLKLRDGLYEKIKDYILRKYPEKASLSEKELMEIVKKFISRLTRKFAICNIHPAHPSFTDPKAMRTREEINKAIEEIRNAIAELRVKGKNNEADDLEFAVFGVYLPWYKHIIEEDEHLVPLFQEWWILIRDSKKLSYAEVINVLIQPENGFDILMFQEFTEIMMRGLPEINGYTVHRPDDIADIELLRAAGIVIDIVEGWKFPKTFGMTLVGLYKQLRVRAEV